MIGMDCKIKNKVLNLRHAARRAAIQNPEFFPERVSETSKKYTPVPRDASVIVTYRCPMRCHMCDIWRNPTDASREIKAADLRSLPRLKFINITGGEPFVREDLAEIVEECYRHTPRIVISTSGWFTDRIIDLARQFPRIGIRVSLEGMERTNDAVRGREGSFSRGMATLRGLHELGVKDIGVACTVSGDNSSDLAQLYRLTRSLGMEFATAAAHNSFYFHKTDNAISRPEKVADDFLALAEMQLGERHPKSWFRAWFNMGLANYVAGGNRMLPCEAGSANFFIDPYGEVFPCNGMECGHELSMGNIRETDFTSIWRSSRAAEVRQWVASCERQCWMVGTASPVMHRYITVPARWALTNKGRTLLGMKPVFSIKNGG